MQTARQQIPERKDYQQPPGSSGSHPHGQGQGMFPPPAQDGLDGEQQTTEMSSNPFRNGGWTQEDGDADAGAGDYKNEYQSTSFNEYDGRYQQTDGFR